MSPRSADLEYRLAVLEAKLGVHHQSPDAGNADLCSRLDSLKKSFESKTSGNFRATLKDSQKIVKELDPGAALTYQQQPLLYRRQEILAASDTLKKDFGEMQKMVNLLMTDQAPAEGGMREDNVTQAPIIVCKSITPEDQRRLDALRIQTTSMAQQAQRLHTKIDNLIECYHAVIAATSEKLILANETISAREEDR